MFKTKFYPHPAVDVAGNWWMILKERWFDWDGKPYHYNDDESLPVMLFSSRDEALKWIEDYLR